MLRWNLAFGARCKRLAVQGDGGIESVVSRRIGSRRYNKRKARTSARAKSRAKRQEKREGTHVEAPPSRFPDWDLEDPLSWEEKFGNFNLSRFGADGPSQPPPKIAPVKPLRSDLLALHELADYPEPPRRRVRLGKSAHAIYGFGDASKDGFGASIEVEGVGIIWQNGVWNLSIREESSNFWEFKNLVESIENFVVAGTLSKAMSCFYLPIIRLLRLPFLRELPQAKNFLTFGAAIKKD
jgi:hypothetical protein